MSFKIIWTPRALQTFDENIDYLREDWNQKVIDDFLERTGKIVELLRATPEVFAFYRSNKIIRKVVVTKQIILYYRIVNKSTVDLITFWNVYQSPKKLKL